MPILMQITYLYWTIDLTNSIVFWNRRGPPEAQRFQQKDFPDKRDKYREEGYTSERYVSSILFFIPLFVVGLSHSYLLLDRLKI